MITRRRFVTSSLAAAGTLGFTQHLVAQMALPSGRLITVSDGHLLLPEQAVIGGLPDGAAELVEAAGFTVDGLENPCNLALWQREEKIVLFDAGAGGGFMPTAGKIIAGLETVGLTPDAITHVVFTHGHPDHLWGVLDDFDEPLFANAGYFMGAAEHAFWSDPATMGKVDETQQSMVAGAARRLEVLGDAVKLIEEGDEVLPGLHAVSLPGHTPGHMGYRIKDGEASVLIAGDAIGNGHLALARPEWSNPFDHDDALGQETRMALLEELAGSGEVFVGFHLPEGGMGTVAAIQRGYRFTAA